MNHDQDNIMARWPAKEIEEMKAEDQSAEREAFEDALCKYDYNLTKTASNEGEEYVFGHARAAWRAWQARAALSAREAPAREGWQPIETAPEEGEFLVYMPEERSDSRIQAAKWRVKVKVIGARFDFDCPPVTHWMPLPKPPAAPTTEGSET